MEGTWRAAAALGGLLALAATVLLPFHVGRGLGTPIAAGFLAGGMALAIASLAVARAIHPRVRVALLWALVGAAGFVVSGAGLVGDVLERPFVQAEIAAVAAVAIWWIVVWLGFRGQTLFAGFSLLCAVCAMAAIVGQYAWEPPAGAVPVRFAYILWGPWGLWLAAAGSR